MLAGWDVRAQSSRPGWGALPYHTPTSNGVTFRVWAPNATSVFVPGQFNDWSTTATPLAKELTNGVWNGNWSADVNGATNGQQYKFYLNDNGSGFWKHDPCARKMVNAADNSGDNDLIYDPAAFNWGGDAPVACALTNLVIYELHIGTFYNPNISRSLPGAFLDATNRLDYLQALGVNAVEVLPVSEFPEYFDWGYDPAGIWAVDNQAYGGPDGFKTFVQACHARGLAVLLDVVHNHYGPTDMDLWDFDGWTGSGAGGGIYFYQDSPQCCTTYGSRPNFSRPQVQNYISNSFVMWLNEYHVDGFRWDTPGLMTNANGTYLPEATTLITNINAYLQTTYLGTNRKISIAEDVMGDGFNSTWDTTFPYTVTPVLTNTVDAQRDLQVLSGALQSNQRFGVASGFNRVNFLESHDVVGDLNSGKRLATAIDPDTPDSYRARKLSLLGAAFTFTAPGVPMLFQGQEMLESEPFSSSLPVDWSKTNTYAAIVQFYHDLIRLRLNRDGTCPGLQGANCSVLQLDNTRKVLAYQRWDGATDNRPTVVILNCSGTALTNYPVTFPGSGTWVVRLNSDSTNYGADFGNVGPATVNVTGANNPSANVTIGAYSVLLLSPALAPPTGLRIVPTTTNHVVMLTWPNNDSGWVVQRSPSLTASATWTPVATSLYQTGLAGLFLTTMVTGAAAFFRLQSSP